MILVTGSLAFDHIMNFPGLFADHILPDKLHMLNVSFLVPEMRKSFGGIAGNISYTLGLLRADVGILAIAGSDFGTYRELLEKTGVDTSRVEIVHDRYTSTAFCVTDNKSNQIWGFYPGADELSERLVIQQKGSTLPTLGIVAPHNPKAMMKFAREYTKLKIPYLFDPGMQLRWLGGTDLSEAFMGAKIIIGNDYEVSIMEKTTGISDLHTLSKEGKIIVTTLGEEGSKITSGNETFSVPAATITALADPSGAGDAYRGGFMAGYMKKKPLPVCGRMGSLAAAYCVESYGTTSHRFTIREFEKRYQDEYNERVSV